MVTILEINILCQQPPVQLIVTLANQLELCDTDVYEVHGKLHLSLLYLIRRSARTTSSKEKHDSKDQYVVVATQAVYGRKEHAYHASCIYLSWEVRKTLRSTMLVRFSSTSTSIATPFLLVSMHIKYS